jgi:hypothetical protein
MESVKYFVMQRLKSILRRKLSRLDINIPTFAAKGAAKMGHPGNQNPHPLAKVARRVGHPSIIDRSKKML